MFIIGQEKGESLYANLVGADVDNSNGDSLGSVEDVLIDRNRKIRALVVDIGGFLGIGAKAIAVRFDKFQQGRAGDGSLELVLPAARVQLQNAPIFKSLAQKVDQRTTKRQQKAK